MWPGDPTWRFSSPRGWHSSWKTHSWGNFAFQAGSLLGRAWRTHGHVTCCDSISGNNVTAARNLRPVDGNETFSSGQVCVWARIIRGGNLSRFADLAKPTPSMLLSLSSSLLNLVTPSYHPRMALDSPPHCFATILLELFCEPPPPHSTSWLAVTWKLFILMPSNSYVPHSAARLNSFPRGVDSKIILILSPENKYSNNLQL